MKKTKQNKTENIYEWLRVIRALLYEWNLAISSFSAFYSEILAGSAIVCVKVKYLFHFEEELNIFTAHLIQSIIPGMQRKLCYCTVNET